MPLGKHPRAEHSGEADHGADDLGVRQGYAITWGVDPPPTAKQLEPLGERFRPYRSIVARYCWEAVALARAGTATDLR